MAREEIVQLYDRDGHPSGTAPRSRMRRENLRHGGTAVLLVDGIGNIYVHQRTATKDVYPGRWDFAAGGVLGAGEDPLDAAERELHEELGVRGVALRPLRRGYYEDEHTRYWGFCYVATWDGPVTHQPEEVERGEWMPVQELARLLEDPDWPVMPDTAALLGDWVRARAERT